MDTTPFTANSQLGSQTLSMVGLKQDADSQKQAASLLEQSVEAQKAVIAAAQDGKGTLIDTFA